ncbi:MAG: FtsW-like cell division membrane protein CA_C0505, partial [uncultured Solirubrobacteraceae bacterium]
ERAQPRAAGAHPGVAAGQRRLRGDLHRARGGALRRLADLRRGVPGPVLRGASGDPLRVAPRRSVPLPAGGGARLLRARGHLPDRRGARARAGAVVRRRPGDVRRDDRLPARGLPRPRAISLHDRGRRAAAADGSAPSRHRPAGQRRLPGRRAGADLVPAGGVLQAGDRRLPRLLPARQPPGPRAGRAPLPRPDHPAAQAVRAADGDLGPRDVDAGLHPRPRVVADVLRRLPRRALRRHQPAVVRRRRPRRLHGRRDVLRAHRLARPGPRRHLAGPVRARGGQRRRLPDRPGDVRPRRRRPVRYGLRPGAARGRRQPDPAGAPHRPHLRGGRQRARPGGRLRAAARLPAGHRAGLSHRDAGHRLVLQAAGHRPHRRLRAAGVRDRRRRDPRHPAHRRDAAVRLLRRLLDPRQLHPAGAAAAGLRPRPPGGAGAGTV